MNIPSFDIAVCGAGTMGSGIAQVCAQYGYRVVLFDINTNSLAAARGRINSSLKALAGKNKIDAAEAARVLERVVFTSELQDCRAVIIIEAVAEELSVKTELLNRLSELNGPGSVLATNTSSLSVTAIATQLRWPQQLAGMHFFNPAPVMKLVEIVQTTHASPEVIAAVTALARAIGKTPVICHDAPGFIVNRVARPFYLEALWLLEKEAAPMSDIDALMEASGFRMGPFALMDLIGNDVNFAVSSIVYASLERPSRLKPSTIQEQKVKQGLLGRKTGRGYYEYPTR